MFKSAALIVGIQVIVLFLSGVAVAASGEVTPLTTEEMASIQGAGAVYKVCNVLIGLGCSAPCICDSASGRWHKTIGNSMYMCGTSTVAPDKPCTNEMLCFCGIRLSFDNEADCHSGENFGSVPVCSYSFGCKDTYNPWGCKWGGPGQ